jgi:hypothetical protein
MQQPGISARQNDVFTSVSPGMPGCTLLFRVIRYCLPMVTISLATASIWNASVDQYVLREGRQVAVPVVDETWSSLSGYTTTYRYAEAGQGNPLHFFESFFIRSDQPRDIGIAHTFGTQSEWRPGPEMAVVAYLPNNPRVHVLVDDFTSYLSYAIGALCLAVTGGLLCNLPRLGRDEPALDAARREIRRGY